MGEHMAEDHGVVGSIPTISILFIILLGKFINQEN